MDRQTAADQALLEGYLGRHHGLVAYLDESFQTPVGIPAVGFYILAATIFPSSEIPAAREELLLASDSARWHTTDQYHLGDFTGILRVATEVGDWASYSLVVFDEIGEESNLESSRRRCMYQLIRELEDRDCSLIVYERRSTRTQINSDAALISKLSSYGYLSRSTRILSSSPAADNLLWAPDLVAWSMRRLVTSGELRWLRGLGRPVEMIFVSEPSEPSLKEKRPGPALAYPGPGLSVDHEGEGISRSSAPIFTHTPAFGQAMTQLLVTTKEPKIEPALARRQLNEIFGADARGKS